MLILRSSTTTVEIQPIVYMCSPTLQRNRHVCDNRLRLSPDFSKVNFLAMDLLKGTFLYIFGNTTGSGKISGTQRFRGILLQIHACNGDSIRIEGKRTMPIIEGMVRFKHSTTESRLTIVKSPYKDVMNGFVNIGDAGESVATLPLHL